MKFRLAKQANYFIPATVEDQVKCIKISQGDIVECKSLDQRKVKFHRKFFALINLAFNNLPEKYDNHFPTADDLRKELLILGGFYTEYTDFYGNKKRIAESMSFNNMGQERFEAVYSKVLDLVCRLIGIEENDIMNELMEFM